MIWIFLTILITVLNFWMINHSKKVDRRIDTLEDSPSDYSVLVKLKISKKILIVDWITP